MSGGIRKLWQADIVEPYNGKIIRYLDVVVVGLPHDTVAVETFALRALSRISMDRLAEEPLYNEQHFTTAISDASGRRPCPQTFAPSRGATQQSLLPGFASLCSNQLSEDNEDARPEIGKRLLKGVISGSNPLSHEPAAAKIAELDSDDNLADMAVATTEDPHDLYVRKQQPERVRAAIQQLPIEFALRAILRRL